MKSILIAATAVGAAIAGLILYGGKKKMAKHDLAGPLDPDRSNGLSIERNAIHNMG